MTPLICENPLCLKTIWPSEPRIIVTRKRDAEAENSSHMFIVHSWECMVAVGREFASETAVQS